MDIQKRSHSGVLTLGVLQIIFGVLWVLCDVFSLSGVTEMWARQQPTAPGQLSQAEIEDIMAREMPAQHVFKWVNSAIDTVLSILMLVSGIGLVRLKAWGRTTAIVYAVGSILFHVYSVVFSIVFVIPAMDAVTVKMQEKMGPNAAGVPIVGIMKASMIAGVVIAALITLYPITVLILVNLKSFRAALSGVPAESFDLPQDYDDRRKPDDNDAGSEQFRQGPDDRYG